MKSRLPESLNQSSSKTPSIKSFFWTEARVVQSANPRQVVACFFFLTILWSRWTSDLPQEEWANLPKISLIAAVQIFGKSKNTCAWGNDDLRSISDFYRGRKASVVSAFLFVPCEAGRTDGRTTRCVSRSFVGGSPWAKFSMLAIFFSLNSERKAWFCIKFFGDFFLSVGWFLTSMKNLYFWFLGKIIVILVSHKHENLKYFWFF